MIKNFLKGMVMGLANIIPGVSGGTMAVSMGIYDKLIHCLTHLFKEFKESILFVLPIILGMGVALVGLSFVITPAFEHFPLQTNCLFIGLIIGGIPAVWKKVKGNKISISHILAFLLFFALVIAMAAMGESEGQAADLSLSLWSVVKLFLVGVIASATMVIPGVSGSMVLLVIGYYNPIVATIKEFAEALAAFNMSEILRCCGILVPMGIGVVIGIFAIAKIIEIIFQKFPLQAYWAIIGLIAASPFAILMVAELGTITALTVLGSVVTFALGFVIAMKLGE
jgi:putative membrane protein